MISSTRAARALVSALAALFVIAPVGAAAPDPNTVSMKLRKDVTVQGITQHLQALQNIATANGGTRASGTPGFAASRDYVVRSPRGGRPRRRRPAVRLRLLPRDRPVVVLAHVRRPGHDVHRRRGLQRHGLLGQRHRRGHRAGRRRELRRSERHHLRLRGRRLRHLRRGQHRAAAARHVPVRRQGRQRPGGGRGRRDRRQPGQRRPRPHRPLRGHARRARADPGDQRELRRSARSCRRPARPCRSRRRRSPRRGRRGTCSPSWRRRTPRRPARRSSSARTWTRSSRARASTTTARARRANLEIAEEMAEDKAPANPVRFAFWGAEEAGLLGSEHYVASLSAGRASRRSG